MTETDIVNQALSLLGEPAIGDIAESTPKAQVMFHHYAPTRDALLRNHPWNFAIKRDKLQRSGVTPLFGYSARFFLPGDFIRLLTFNEDKYDLCKDEIAIEGKFLLTKSNEARVTYVSRVTDVNLFDPLFVQLLAVKLASVACVEITGSDSRRASLDALASQYLQGSAAVDANESARGVIGGHSRAIGARYRGGRSPGYPQVVVGPPGKAVELRVSNGFVQWRLEEGTWEDLYEMSLFQGPAGADGADGANGADGADGANGADGREVSLRMNGNDLEWQYSGAGNWTYLITLGSGGGWETGDRKETFRATPSAGWILCSGSIGKAGSGATRRANADCEDLFKFLWSAISVTYAPVSGGKGISAQADWDAGKTIELPDSRGRGTIGIDYSFSGVPLANRVTASGTGNPGIASTVLGAVGGVDRYTLTHQQSGLPSHTHGVRFDRISDTTGGGGGARIHNIRAAGASGNGNVVIISGEDAAQAHPIMQPSVVVYVHIKL